MNFAYFEKHLLIHVTYIEIYSLIINLSDNRICSLESSFQLENNNQSLKNYQNFYLRLLDKSIFLIR